MGDGKNKDRETLEENYCNTVKNQPSGTANLSKNCSSDIHSILNYVSFPPRTGSKPLLTVRKPIKNPVLSPTFLQIYCIGLIGLVTHFLWVWAAICDPTIGAVYGEN